MIKENGANFRNLHTRIQYMYSVYNIILYNMFILMLITANSILFLNQDVLQNMFIKKLVMTELQELLI